MLYWTRLQSSLGTPVFLLDKYLLFGSTQEDNFANIKDRNLAKHSVDAEECESWELFIISFPDVRSYALQALSEFTEGFWFLGCCNWHRISSDRQPRQHGPEAQWAGSLPLTLAVSSPRESVLSLKCGHWYVSPLRHLRHFLWQVSQKSWFSKHADRRSPVVILQHRHILERKKIKTISGGEARYRSLSLNTALWRPVFSLWPAGTWWHRGRAEIQNKTTAGLFSRL